MDWSVISWQARWWKNLGEERGNETKKFTERETTLYATPINVFQKKSVQPKNSSIYILAVKTDSTSYQFL